jgi:hypothetical protein
MASNLLISRGLVCYMHVRMYLTLMILVERSELFVNAIQVETLLGAIRTGSTTPGSVMFNKPPLTLVELLHVLKVRVPIALEMRKPVPLAPLSARLSHPYT